MAMSIAKQAYGHQGENVLDWGMMPGQASKGKNISREQKRKQVINFYQARSELERFRDLELPDRFTKAQLVRCYRELQDYSDDLSKGIIEKDIDLEAIREQIKQIKSGNKLLREGIDLVVEELGAVKQKNELLIKQRQNVERSYIHSIFLGDVPDDIASIIIDSFIWEIAGGLIVNQRLIENAWSCIKKAKSRQAIDKIMSGFSKSRSELTGYQDSLNDKRERFKIVIDAWNSPTIEGCGRLKP